MTLKATWLLSTDLKKELYELSHKLSKFTIVPIYANDDFYLDLKTCGLVDLNKDIYGNYYVVVGLHSVYRDNQAPDYSCSQDIVSYYIQQLFDLDSAGGVGLSDLQCDCNLGGAHESWCDRWEAY